MRTKQLADWLGLHPGTIRSWVGGPFRRYLSPSAQGGDGRTRNFTDTDARIIALIAALKGEAIPTDEIHATLTRLQSEEWVDLPPMPSAPPGVGPVPMISREAAETAVATQRQALMREIAILEDRVDTLESRLVSEQERRETLQNELTTARELLGELRGQLDSVDRERQSWQTDRRLLLRGLVVLSIVGVVLFVLLMLALTGGAG